MILRVRQESNAFIQVLGPNQFKKLPTFKKITSDIACKRLNAIFNGSTYPSNSQLIFFWIFDENATGYIRDRCCHQPDQLPKVPLLVSELLFPYMLTSNARLFKEKFTTCFLKFFHLKLEKAFLSKKNMTRLSRND